MFVILFFSGKKLDLNYVTELPIGLVIPKHLFYGNIL